MAPEANTTDRRLVVGLGNPGRKYVGTRHNVGFEVLETLRSRWSMGDGKEAFEGLHWSGRWTRRGQDQPVMMLAPMTYMNRSGRAVRGIVEYFRLPLENVLVVMDDTALPLGQLRARGSGSAGGHNGLADILQACGSDTVPRLRVGIDRAPGRMDSKDYVLGKFTPPQREAIDCAIPRAADAVEDWVFHGLSRVMEIYNRRDPEE